MKKVILVIVILKIAAIAYVLGTRAGRQRYRELKAGAETVWNDPLVKKVRRRAAKRMKKAKKAAVRSL